MKKLYLIQNQEVFQGEKCLKRKQNYFEGWYFKNTSDEGSISFIPGISRSKKEQKAFIQVITNDSSYFIPYDIEDFTFHSNPFFIQIKNNYFSLQKVHIDIDDKIQNLKIYGEVEYSHHQNLKTNFLSPNIMGPFSYFSFMECHHAILSMKNRINGEIKVNQQNIRFLNATGYIEKDWGTSFPKTYLWCQANHFKYHTASFMFSVADIPFPFCSFRGMICVLIFNHKEYKFTTYNCSKLLHYEVKQGSVHIILKKGKYTLSITSFLPTAQKLTAPVHGNMSKDIFETIEATITITLKKGKKVIFKDESTHCGLEIVE